MENFTIEKMEIKRFNALLVRTIASTLLLGWIAWWIYCIDNNESTWGMSYFNAFVLLIYAAVPNLKQMAATVAAMEQYGFTPDELDAALVSANADLHSSTAKLKLIETAIREKKDLQKQVLAYAKTRDVRDGLKKQKTDKARKAYREKHESDFIIADAATRYFKQKGVTKLPTYKALQAEIEQFTAEKNALYNEYRANKARVRELQTMKSNLSQMQHGEPSRQKRHEQER